MSISNEPIWWWPFSGGGMFAAFFVPVHLVLFGLALPLAWVTDPGGEAMKALVEHPLVRLYLFVFAAGCLIHAAHRIRYLLVELGLHALGGPIAIACYGGAVAGSAWAAWVAFAP
jgi:fumarate reductase subunit D